MVKLYNLRTFPLGVEGDNATSKKPLNNAQQNSFFRILIRQFFGKSGVGGGLVALQIFGHL